MSFTNTQRHAVPYVLQDGRQVMVQPGETVREFAPVPAPLPAPVQASVQAPEPAPAQDDLPAPTPEPTPEPEPTPVTKPTKPRRKRAAQPE